MRFTFRRHERVRLRRDIFRARQQGRKTVGHRIVVWAYRRPETPVHASRFGLLLGRKAGGAVQRNLFKRRMREIFRLHKNEIPRGWDFLVTPKIMRSAENDVPPNRFPPSFLELRKDFLDLVIRLTRPIKHERT